MKSKNLIILSACTLAVTATLELVKVPLQVQVTEVYRYKPDIRIERLANGNNSFNCEVKDGYGLTIDENGDMVAEKLVPKVMTKTVALKDYLDYHIRNYLGK